MSRSEYRTKVSKSIRRHPSSGSAMPSEVSSSRYETERSSSSHYETDVSYEMPPSPGQYTTEVSTSKHEMTGSL